MAELDEPIPAGTLHEALPQMMTPENLALWIKENQVEQFEHVDETPLSQEEITELEHKSSLASRAIDDLDDLEKSFKKTLKEGTEEPVDFTIPPTKGTKALKSNREFADDKIKAGVNEEKTMIYGIPYPEEKKIIFFDIEGHRFQSRDRDMSDHQITRFDKPLLRELGGNPDFTDTVTMFPNRSQANGDEGDETVSDGPTDDQETKEEELFEKPEAGGKKSGKKGGGGKKKEKTETSESRPDFMPEEDLNL